MHLLAEIIAVLLVSSATSSQTFVVGIQLHHVMKCIKAALIYYFEHVALVEPVVFNRCIGVVCAPGQICSQASGRCGTHELEELLILQ